MSRDSALKETKNSGVPKHSTNDTSGVQLILAPPVSFPHEQLLNQDIDREELKRKVPDFVDDPERGEDETFEKRTVGKEIRIFLSTLKRFRKEKMFCVTTRR